MGKLDNFKDTNLEILKEILGDGIDRLLDVRVLESRLEGVPYDDINKCSFEFTVPYLFLGGELTPSVGEGSDFGMNVKYTHKETGALEEKFLTEPSLLRSFDPNGEDVCIELITQLHKKTTDQVVGDLFDKAVRNGVKMDVDTAIKTLIEQAESMMKSRDTKDVERLVIRRSSTVPKVTIVQDPSDSSSVKRTHVNSTRVLYDRSILFYKTHGVPSRSDFNNEVYTVKQAVFVVEGGRSSNTTSVEKFQVRTYEELKRLITLITGKTVDKIDV